ncbi:uncharacterized protein LOC128283920 [Gossypium arboreum]|uniref:uncharacterized protein LOC128283920 n=1 Tax=Gossypium arboreum TaxID=29729 RepID=UPI0022F15908|nr:uncharacterized protein LOC128283920 [Gossypium arboreum]
MVGAVEGLELSPSHLIRFQIWTLVRSVSPITKTRFGTGSHDRVARDNAQSQPMLRILERVAGPNTSSGGRGSVTERLRSNGAEKLKGAVSLLHDEAYQWWLKARDGTQPDQLAWDLFKTVFQSKYVGANYIDARRRDFLNLTPGDRSVAEYEAKFLRLSRYARGMVATEYERCVHFEDSLRDNLRIKRRKKARSDGPVRVGPTIAPTGEVICQLSNRRHLGECWRSTGACLRCGSTEHHVKDCLLRTNHMQALTIETAPLPRVVQQPLRGRGQLGVVTAWAEDRENRVEVLAKLRRGSTHSYIASTVSETLGLPLEVQGTVFLADLMELPFGEFDLILGKDWLVKHRVNLDCAVKRIVLRTEKDIEVVVFGKRGDYLTNVLSALVAEKLVRKGCEAYWAYISVVDSGDSSVKEIRTVKDFLNVFSKELQGLPPNREVEFGIELFPGTALVSITPYRMAPKELTELKAQI